MPAYLALIAGADADRWRVTYEALHRGLLQAGWRRLDSTENASLYAPTGGTIAWRRFGPGWVIGDVIDLPERPPPNAASSALDCAQRLLDLAFGRYVFVASRSPGEAGLAMRDPSGGLGGLSMALAGGHLVTDHLPAVVLPWVSDALQIDWRGVSAWMSDVGTLQSQSGLLGVRPLIPGAARRLGSNDEDRALWRPSVWATRPIHALDAAEAALARAIQRATVGLADGAVPILAEVSGGLDSSIVAEALAGARAPVRAWLNIATDDPRGDERLYARALCDHLGLSLTVAEAPPLRLSPEAIALSQTGHHPSLSGLDEGAEGAVLSTATAVGARRVFTGLGGDSVLFAFATPLIFRDAVLRRGLAALGDPLLEALARWTRTSVWGLARRGLFGSQDRFPATPSDWIVPAGPIQPHPWLEDGKAVPPGRRFQLESIVQTQATLGPCRRTAALELVHPLLSQPVLEACLQIPVDQLVTGGRDRGLARRAYAGRLPALVATRRSKGDVAIRFGAALIEGLAEIRPYLLDGRLAAQGVIDRARLETTLQPETLPQGNQALTVLQAIAVEAWVRRWEGARSCLPQPAGPGGA